MVRWLRGLPDGALVEAPRGWWTPRTWGRQPSQGRTCWAKGWAAVDAVLRTVLGLHSRLHHGELTLFLQAPLKAITGKVFLSALHPK